MGFLRFRDPKTLSKKAVEVLTFMRDNDEEIVTDGLEVWYGLNKTNWRLLTCLLECCFVSQDQYSPTHYSLNGSGERFLEGLAPYIDANGKAHKNANDI